MRSFSLRLLALGLSALAVAACSSGAVSASKKTREPVMPGDDFYEEAPPVVVGDPDYVNEDGFGAGERPASQDPGPGDAGAADARSTDAGPADAGPTDAGRDVVVMDAAGDGAPTRVLCSGPLAAGDLIVSELMIASRSGTGDEGEWIELESTRSCWLQLRGLTVESPRGASSADSASVQGDLELAPFGHLLVAGSADPAKNHGLPSPVVAFGRADVLKNDGDRVTVKAGAIVVDQLDYPSFSNLTAGRSVAFPKSCPRGVRSDWGRWSLTFATFAAGQRGTPGGDNTDVACY